VRPVAVVVDQVLVQHPAQVGLVDDEHPVQQLSAEGADHPLADRIRAGRLRWRLDDPDALGGEGGGEDGVEPGGEQGIAVADEEPQGADPLTHVEQDIAGLLGHPVPGRVAGHPGHVHPPVGDLDEDQHVKPAQQHRLHGDEVAADDRPGPGR
jgi:hypothetical protein